MYTISVIDTYDVQLVNGTVLPQDGGVELSCTLTFHRKKNVLELRVNEPPHLGLFVLYTTAALIAVVLCS